MDKVNKYIENNPLKEDDPGKIIWITDPLTYGLREFLDAYKDSRDSLVIGNTDHHLINRICNHNYNTLKVVCITHYSPYLLSKKIHLILKSLRSRNLTGGKRLGYVTITIPPVYILFFTTRKPILEEDYEGDWDFLQLKDIVGE